MSCPRCAHPADTRIQRCPECRNPSDLCQYVTTFWWLILVALVAVWGMLA